MQEMFSLISHDTCGPHSAAIMFVAIGLIGVPGIGC